MKTRREVLALAPAAAGLLALAGCSGSTDAADTTTASHFDDALYLGVENYGKEETNRDRMTEFNYRFEVDGEERVFQIDNGEADADGAYAFPIQNQLKEGYHYKLTCTDMLITAVEELPSEEPNFEPLVSGTPGERTLANFLRTALAPVGTTLYIYGGGWNWQDEAGSIQARTLGVSRDWVSFFQSQDDRFTYAEEDGDEAKTDTEHTYFPYFGYNEYYYAGLDCSGYLGWTLYNTFETTNDANDYVEFAGVMAKHCADRGWGAWTHEVADPASEKGKKAGFVMRPGDIMSMDGHTWVSLGTCDDGSVVILHSTPSMSRSGQPGGGVQISALGPDENCDAYALADEYMQKYSTWFERYPACVRDPAAYFAFEDEDGGAFTWDTEGDEGLADPDGLQSMGPKEVLELLFAGME